MSIKIERAKRSRTSYLGRVAWSIRHLNEHYKGSSRAISEGEMDDKCKAELGVNWVYDVSLGACVDTRKTELNRNLSVSDGQLVVNEAGLSDAALMDVPTITPPDAHGQCPIGTRWSGHWGGCISWKQQGTGGLKVTTRSVADSIQYDLARTVHGTSAYGDDQRMQSGGSYANNVRRKVNTNEKKKVRFRV